MFKKLLIAILVLTSTTSVSGQAIKVSVKDTITDSELVVPEDIERNFDQLLVEWKKDMKPSSECTSNFDMDVAYPDSVYIDRLYSLPTIMELAYNPIVRSYIDMYTGRMRNSVEYFLGKSHYYFPIFEEALDKYGLPLELKYLPIIESALNPTIVSKAGATGLWQFMLGTGKMYDLEINSLVDERRDPYRSTDAAARYLKDLYNIYGDWNLVIAAYNCGPGNVNKAIKRNGGQSDYWSIYPFLPKETRGYVPAFIAATYVMNYPEAHNICPFEYKYNASTDTITVDRYLHFQQLADVLDISIEDIRNLNPQFKTDIVPGEFKPYAINLPSKTAADFHVNRDSVYAYRANDFLVHRKVVEPNISSTKTKIIRYKVRRGESLASIASKNGVTTKQIRRWNRLNSNRVKTGQILAIHKTVAVPKSPTKQETTQTQYNAENTPKQSTTTPAVASDTIRDQLAPSMLAEYFEKYSKNKKEEPNSAELTDDDLDAIEETRTPNEQQTIYHKVRIGETISLIASKYNVDKSDIAKWNKLKSAVPKIGQRLVIHLPTTIEKNENDSIEGLDEDVISEIAKTMLVKNDNQVSSNSDQPYKEYGPSPAIASVQQPKATNNKPTEPVRQSPKKATPSKPKTTVYTVRKGDTLSSIALKMGGKTTSKDIMKANRLKSDKLKIGQKLRIPR